MRTLWRVLPDEHLHDFAQLTIGEWLAEEWPRAMGLRQMKSCEGGHKRKSDFPALQYIGNRLDRLIDEIDIEQSRIEIFMQCNGESP